MDRLRTLELFIAVAQNNSFAGAARALHVSPAAVTRGVAALEQRLGQMLFHRSTRAVSLTNQGALFLPRAIVILADLEEAERDISGGAAEPTGEIVVTAPVHFGQMHVMPVLIDLIERYPLLSVHSLFVDRNVRMVEEGIDVAVRIGRLPDSAMKAIKIGEVRPVMVASPDYLARFGYPKANNGFAGHRLISTSGPRAATEWRGNGTRDVTAGLRPRLKLNTAEAMITAACNGGGIASLLSYQVDHLISKGSLKEVAIPNSAAHLPVHLLFEANRRSHTATRSFVDAMSDYAKDQGWRRS